MIRQTLLAGLIAGSMLAGSAEAAIATLTFEAVSTTNSKNATGFNPAGGAGQSLAINFGKLYATGAGTLTFTYLGKEANDTNAFYVTAGTTLFQTAATPGKAATAVNTTFTENISKAGYLTFGFSTLAPTSDKNSVSSSQVFNNYGSFAIIAGSKIAAYSSYDYVLLYNDCGGSGCAKGKGDYDFDDMVVGVKFKALTPPPVPEPENIAMMMAGLGIVGGLARRRKARV